MVGISSIISGLAAPISNVITKFVTRKEDQMRVQAEIEKIQKDFETKILENQNNVLQAQKDIVLAEVQGHWFQRNWRPALMWIIICVIANNYLIAPLVNQIATVLGGENIFPALELPDKLFNLMTIGLGGYVVGRSAEKIIPQLAETKALITSGTTQQQLEEKKVQKAQIREAVTTATKKPETPYIGPIF